MKMETNNFNFSTLIVGFLVFFLFQTSAFSNNDSLRKVFYEDTKLSIDNKINLAKTLSDLYSENDLQKVIECNIAIYHFSELKNDEKEMMISLDKIWRCQNKLLDYSSADTTLKMLLSMVNITDDNSELAELMFNIANNYYNLSKYKSSIEYFQKAQYYFSLMGNKQGVAKCLSRMAIVVSNWGDYEEAIGLLQNAREIYVNFEDDKGLADINLSLGIIMQEWNKLESALKYYQQAYKLFDSKNMKSDEVRVLLRIGDVFVLRKNYYDAIVFYKKAKKLESEINRRDLKSIILSNLGKAYYYLNQYDSALFYQSESLNITYLLGDGKQKAISYWIMGNTYFKLNENDSSIKYLLNSLLISQKIGNRKVELDALKSLADNYYTINNFNLAFQYLKKYQSLNELLFTDNTNRVLEELDIKYESNRRDIENKLLKQNNNIQELQIEKEKNAHYFTIIFSSFLVFIAFVIVFFVNYRIKQGRKNLSILTFKNKEIIKQKEKLSKLNEELAQSRENYRGIIENATIGIYQTMINGEIVFANRTLVNTLGYESLESLKIVNLNNQNPSRKFFLDLIIQQEVIKGREDIWTKADGTKMYVMESAWLVKNSNGSINHIEGIIEDISIRKEIESALKKSEEQLKDSNIALFAKNKQLGKAKKEVEEAYKAKSSFLANVSHEIRTPMNSIIGFTELLLSIEKDSKKITYISAIDSSSKSLLALITDILDLSKIQSGKLELINEPVNIRSILNEMLQSFSLHIKQKEIDFQININEKLPQFIILDGVKIRQVLFNLLSNAIKFTDHGFVKIIVDFDKSELGYINLKITVSDSGMGISVKDQTIIFSEFTQSKPLFGETNKGTGLGLTITKQIVELMNGKLELESLLGKGSTFTISIPHLSEIEVRNSKIIGAGKQTFVEKYKSEGIQKSDFVSLNVSEIDEIFVLEMKNKFGKEFSEIMTTRLIEDILKFSTHLQNFAMEKQIKLLIEVSVKLNDSCEEFDIESIESILLILKTLFDE